MHNPISGEKDSKLEDAEVESPAQTIHPHVISEFTDFNFSLLHNLCFSNPVSNVVASPLSAYALLTMVHPGCAGNTLTQIQRLLGISNNEESYESISAILARTRALSENTPHTLTMKNSIWLDGSTSLQPDFQTLSEKYFEGIFTSLNASDNVAQEQILHFLQDLSDGSFPDISELIPDQGMVLVNDIRFENAWSDNIESIPIQAQAFYSEAEKHSPVATMKIRGAATFSDDEVQVASIPCKDDDLAVLLIMPKHTQSLAQTPELISSENFKRWTENVENMGQDICMPGFSWSTTLSLKDHLASLGMPLAFFPIADMPAIASSKMHIGNLIHHIKIEVTSRAMATSTMDIQAMDAAVDMGMQINQPFYVFVYNPANQLIYLSCKITQPVLTSFHNDASITEDVDPVLTPELAEQPAAINLNEFDSHISESTDIHEQNGDKSPEQDSTPEVGELTNLGTDPSHPTPEAETTEAVLSKVQEESSEAEIDPGFEPINTPTPDMDPFPVTSDVMPATDEGAAEPPTKRQVETGVVTHAVDEPISTLPETTISTSIEPDEEQVTFFLHLILKEAIKKDAEYLHFFQSGPEPIIFLRDQGKLDCMAQPSADIFPRVIHRLIELGGISATTNEPSETGIISFTLPDQEVAYFEITVLTRSSSPYVILKVLKDKIEIQASLKGYGLTGEQVHTFKQFLQNQHGIMLFSGKNGTGKNTLAYECVEELISTGRSAAAIHNHVDRGMQHPEAPRYVTDRFNSMCTYLSTLQNLDYDAIYASSLIAREEFELLLESGAYFNKFMLATLPASYGLNTLSRLLNMGIAPWLISSNNMLIHSQMLLRRICKECKHPVVIPAQVLIDAGMNTANAQTGKIYHGRGCSACNHSGYNGMLPVGETFILPESAKEMVEHGVNAAEIGVELARSGVSSTRNNALDAMSSGETTLEQVLLHTAADFPVRTKQFI